MSRTPDALLGKYKVALESMERGSPAGQSLVVVVSRGDELLHLEADESWMQARRSDAERETVRMLCRFLRGEAIEPGGEPLDDSVSSLDTLSRHVRDLLLMRDQENFVNTAEGSFKKPVRYCLVTASGPTHPRRGLAQPVYTFETPPKPRGVLMLLSWALAEDAQRDEQDFRRVRLTIDERRTELEAVERILRDQRPKDVERAKPLEAEIKAAAEAGHSRAAIHHLERFEQLLADLKELIARDTTIYISDQDHHKRKSMELGKRALEEGYWTEKRSASDNDKATQLLKTIGVEPRLDADPKTVEYIPELVQDVLGLDRKKRLEEAEEGFKDMHKKRFGFHGKLAGAMRYLTVALGLLACAVLRLDLLGGLVALGMGLAAVGAAGAFAVKGQPSGGRGASWAGWPPTSSPPP